MTIAIVQGEESDLPEVAGLFAAAFHDDPVIAVMIPGERNRLQRLTKVFLSELRTGAMAGGAVDLARREDDGRLVGAAAWESPDRKTSSWAKVRELPRVVSAVGLRHLPQTLRTLDVFAKSRPDHAHWYLVDIVVGEEARGLGIGSRLLNHRLEVVDEAGLPAYLEATTLGSQRLYERFGFTAKDWLHMTESDYPVTMYREIPEG